MRVGGDLDERLLEAGKKLGLRPDRIRRATRLLRRAVSPRDEARRRRAAKAFLASQGRDDRLDPQRGYTALAPGALPGARAAVEAAARIVAARREAGRLQPAPGQRKDFLIDVLEPGDLEKEPAIAALILGDDVLRIAVSYLGTTPRLQTIQLLWTPANQTERQSQNFHLDQIDARQAKFVLNISPVGPENGPFSCLPASASARMAKRLGKRAYKRVSDEEAFREIDRAQLFEALGPPGSGVLVDSSRCFHFGSRSRGGERVVLIFHFTGPWAPAERGTQARAELAPYAVDEVRRLVLSA